MRAARSNIEEDQDTRPSNIICDLLDPQAAQSNDDVQGVEEALEQGQILRTYDGDVNEGSSGSSIFKTGDLSNIDRDLASTQQLAGEQQIVLNRVIGYCKELRKAKENGSRKPKAPLNDANLVKEFCHIIHTIIIGVRIIQGLLYSYVHKGLKIFK